MTDYWKFLRELGREFARGTVHKVLLIIWGAIGAFSTLKGEFLPESWQQLRLVRLAPNLSSPTWLAIMAFMLLILVIQASHRLHRKERQMWMEEVRDPLTREYGKLIEKKRLESSELKVTFETTVARLQAKISEYECRQPRIVATVVRDGDFVYLLIENTGTAAAAFWATLKVEGVTRDIPRQDVFARWDHTATERTEIPAGGEHRLKLSRLEYGSMVFSGNWHIFFTCEGVPGEGRAASSWVHGEHYEDTSRNSSVILWIKLFSNPHFEGAPILKRVELCGVDSTEVLPMTIGQAKKSIGLSD